MMKKIQLSVLRQNGEHINSNKKKENIKMKKDFQNMVLSNAMMSNNIYLSEKTASGSIMSNKRRDFTEETLQASVIHMKEHAASTGKAVFSWKMPDQSKGTLAFIPDELFDSFNQWCETNNYKKKD